MKLSHHHRCFCSIPKVVINLLLTLIFVLFAAGCTNGTGTTPQVTGTSTQKVTFTLGVNDIYCKDSACKCVHHIAARTYYDLQQQVADTAGIELKLVYFPDSIALEKAVASGNLDGFICKPWLATWFGRASSREFKRIADITDPNGNQWLTGIVVVKAGSPFKKLSELNGKVITSGQPDSYEKHFAAFAMFEQAGIKPGKIIQKSSCIENLGELLDGHCDAAVISDYAITADCAVDFAKPEDFDTIAVTEKIPLTSVMVDSKKVSPEDTLKLQNALLKFTGANTPKSFLGSGFLPPAPWQPETIKTWEKP